MCVTETTGMLVPVLYVRELGEVCGVEAQSLGQPLHQVQALVAGEGAGGENHTQQGVTFWRSTPMPHPDRHPAVKMLFLLGRCCHNSYPQMGHCAQAKATVV